MSTSLDWPRFFGLAVVVSAAMTARPAVEHKSRVDGRPEASPRVVDGYGRLPLSFDENRGQTDGQVRFMSRGQGYGLFLTPTETVLALRKPVPREERHDRPGRLASSADTATTTGTVLRIRLLGANPSPVVKGVDELPGKSNYFIGNDQTKWKTGVRQFGGVLYENVYPGIDLEYYGNQRQLEHDFIVKPGAVVKQIRFRVEGAESVKLNGSGELALKAGGGEVIERAPVVYQEVGGERQRVDGRYELRGEDVGFEVGAYDKTRPLVIDPVLVYSTYLGGSGFDSGTGIAVDASGNAYLTGHTYSLNFPTANTVQGTFGGLSDVFVTKLDAAGSALVYSTYLGGSGNDVGHGIAVDASGNAYVTGETYSSNFPTANAVQGIRGGEFDAFVTKLNAAGSALVYSTYLGGSGSNPGNGSDFGYGITVDAAGSAYVTGETSSPNFPTANAVQGTRGGGNEGGNEGFVTKLNAAGSALVYSTYLGGSDHEAGTGIAVDVSGNAYVTGYTTSSNFPTANAFQGNIGGFSNAFVTKLNAAGSALVYSTYLGGSDHDYGYGIAVDASASAYVTGATFSSNFPTANAVQGTSGRGYDAFVTKLNATGSALVYSTYLGGSEYDYGYGIAVDASGNAYVTGMTFSSNFPTANAVQTTSGENGDALVTKLNAAGSALVYSTYLGGRSNDKGYGIAVDASGNAYLTGQTYSSNFPTANAVQGTFGGDLDAYVLKLGDVSGPSLSITDVTVTEGHSGTTPAVFTVLLAPESTQVVTVDHVTARSGALPGSDYFDVSGTLTFPPGTTSQTVTVSVLGDRVVEPDEVFFIGLRNARGATLSKVLGKGTILNDDLPGLSIADVTVSEGSSANAAFLVTLTPARAQTTSVAYSTSNGAATAGTDYTAVSGTVTFTSGRTMQTIIVPILTDSVTEGSETFFVDLSNPVGTTIASGRGTATINDPPAAAKVPMYRAYNRSADYHLFTTSLASKDFAVSSLGYQDESTPVPFYVWNTQQAGALPLFRLFNPNRGRHFYTTGVGDRDYLISIGMNYEGEEGFVHPTQQPGTVELFRLYNTSSGTHLYTAVAEQKDFILATFPGVWVPHTSVGFVFTSP